MRPFFEMVAVTPKVLSYKCSVCFSMTQHSFKEVSEVAVLASIIVAEIKWTKSLGVAESFANYVRTR